MYQSLRKSDIAALQDIDLNEVFEFAKSKHFPPKDKKYQIQRNTIALIYKYARKYNIDITSVLDCNSFLSYTEKESDDMYELGVINEVKRILKTSQHTSLAKLYNYILNASATEREKLMEYYILALDNSAIVQIVDKDGIVRYVNDMYKAVSGDKRNLIGKKVSGMGGKLFHSDAFWKDLWETVLKGEVWKGTIQNPRMDQRGESYYTYTTITPVKNDLGEIIEFITIKFDITISKKLQIELEKLNQELNEILNSTSQGFWIITKDLVLLEVNESLCKMLGYPRNEIIGKKITDFMDEKNRAILAEQVKNIETTSDRKYHIDFTKKNGEPLPVILEASTLFDENGKFKKAIAFITDITEIRKDQKELYDVAIKDQLTGIWNRRLFDTSFNNYFRHIKEKTNDIESMCVCLFDIDHFKNINDSRGHAVGDIVLKEFGTRLLHITSENIEVFRYGGEEFGVIGHNIDLESFIQIMENFREYNEKNPAGTGAGKVHFTVSGGIAHYNGNTSDFDTPRDLFIATDRQLYEAKGSGRNQIKAQKK